MGAVCPAALLGSLVDLDVLDDQVAGIEALGIGIGLGVLEETQQELGGLDGPAGAGDTPLLACVPKQSASFLDAMPTLRNPDFRRNSSSTTFFPPQSRYRRNRIFEQGLGLSNRTLGSPADGTSVAPHGNGLLLVDDVLEEGLGALELPAIDRLGSLAGVLEGNAEVRPAGASRLGRRNLSRCVPNLKATETRVSMVPV